MIKHAKSEGFLDTLRYGAIGLSIILLIAGGAFMVPTLQDYFTGGDQEWKIEPVDFLAFEKPSTANNYLACPEYMCPFADPDTLPPIYSISAEKLRENLLGFVDTRPGITLRSLDLVKNQFDFSVYTQDMDHPDVVTVQLHDLRQEHSTLAIYSWSPLETEDGGRNKKRVELWLKMLGPIKDVPLPSP